MQSTIQETAEATGVLSVKKTQKETFSINVQSRRQRDNPVKMAAVAALFLAMAMSLSWVSNGLFLKELAISGSIILMVIALRVMGKPRREVSSRFHQNNLN